MILTYIIDVGETVNLTQGQGQRSRSRVHLPGDPKKIEPTKNSLKKPTINQIPSNLQYKEPKDVQCYHENFIYKF